MKDNKQVMLVVEKISIKEKIWQLIKASEDTKMHKELERNTNFKG
jgi:hypothetical protein